MNSFKLSDRWGFIHQLIKQEKTGALRQFAKHIGISKSQLSREIESMKQIGAPIEFCKIRKTYYYTHHVKFDFGFKSIDNNALNRVHSKSPPQSIL